MIKTNPQLRQYSAATSAQTSGKAASAVSESFDDEAMSEGPQSDQMTVSSPISQEIFSQSAYQSQSARDPTTVASTAMAQKALRKVINSEVEKKLKHLTQSI